MDERPSPTIETCLFRIVQEATTNIAKHASATSCRVYVQRLPASVVLTVEDNGRGFDPQTERLGAEEGLGLLGIQERVADAGGTFRIESAPGRGTRLYVELPALGLVSADGSQTAHTDTGRVDEERSKEFGDGTHPAGG